MIAVNYMKGSDFLKVPVQYKSSDRYNAGVDVIYDDDSKLQYAPFIYATTKSGDNGADDGGDEEGEDSMIVIYDNSTNSIDKSFKDLKEAIDVGKIAVLKRNLLDDETGFIAQVYYLTKIRNETVGKYYAIFASADSDAGVGELSVMVFEAANETDNMALGLPG